jgi:hypothetical protein
MRVYRLTDKRYDQMLKLKSIIRDDQSANRDNTCPQTNVRYLP